MPSELKVPDGWAAIPLAELTSTGSVTYGVVQPGADTPTGIPLIRVNNFTGNGLDTTALMRIAPQVESKYGRTRLQAGDVLITIVGSVGSVAVAPPSMAGWNIARAVALVRPKSPELSRWIAFCLRSPFSKYALGVAANTTVQTTINLKDLKQLLLPMPPEAERRGLVEVLSALDDRIDLLRQTNTTLESIAQALFKSWFIDFDPVRAKQAGREPEGMDAATAALFPAEFEESALGLIPKGWAVGTFGDLATLVKGTVNPLNSPSTLFEHYSLPAFDAAQLPVFETGDAIKSNKTRVPPGTVLHSKLNPQIPRVWFPSQVGKEAVCSTEFLPWLARATASPEVVYCVLTSPTFEAEVRTLVTGTSNSHQRVKPDQVAGLTLVTAPTPIYQAFTDAVRPHLRRAGENRWSARNLADLRDTLLPRLISGKLRLSETQEKLEKIPA